MLTRRQIIKYMIAAGAIASGFFNGSFSALKSSWAATRRRIIEKGTPMSKLIYGHPKRLETSRLETTPIDEFETMGETTRIVDVEQWQLVIDGEVERPLILNYQDILIRESIERHALLICPGFFAYNGFWKGISIAQLLAEAGVKTKATHVKCSGSGGFRKRTKRFKLEEVLSEQVYAAYGVNDQILPQRHGYPLRLVAENYRGRHWIKYLNHITVTAGKS